MKATDSGQRPTPGQLRPDAGAGTRWCARGSWVVAAALRASRRPKPWRLALPVLDVSRHVGDAGADLEGGEASRQRAEQQKRVSGNGGRSQALHTQFTLIT